MGCMVLVGRAQIYMWHIWERAQRTYMCFIRLCIGSNSQFWACTAFGEGVLCFMSLRIYFAL
jgi:hypothetical protein